MSIVAMKKMSLIAHSSEESRLMKVFLKTGCVEIITANLQEMTSYPNLKRRREEIDLKLLKVSFAINFLKETLNRQKLLEKKSKEKKDESNQELLKVSFKKENKLVALEEYEEIAKDEIELFSYISEIEHINSSMVDIKSEKARNFSLIEQLTPYIDIDIKFSEIKDSKNVVFFLGYIPAIRSEAVNEKLKDKAFLKLYDGDKFRALFISAHRDKEAEIAAILSENEFSKCPFTFERTPAEKIAELNSDNLLLDERRQGLWKEGIELLTFADRLKLLYDHYLIEIAKIECLSKSPGTNRIFIMEGWVPAGKALEIEKEVSEKCKRAELFFRDPLENENPPTLTSNGPLVKPFTGITDNFGKPNYRERDPNLFVALFYFLIFGIMMGDAGYGLLIAIACFAMVKVIKPVKDSGKMLLMFGLCGISTFVWGIAFGSWFGIEPTHTFLKYFTWFNPMKEPLLLFMLSLAVGILQIGTGFLLKGIAEIKMGRALRGILNNFSWVIIFVGIYCLFPNGMIFLGAIKPEPVPTWFAVAGNIGMYIALVGLALLVIGGMIGKKNPIKMVGGALGNVYGSINVMSDILSYSRLFGLGLTTGVIGYAINILGTIIVDIFFKGLWIGWIVAAPILLIGHTFNLAINLLGAYVHNSRLQYVEFFGRFYEGSGHAFMPLGSKTKYSYLDN